MAFFTHKDPTHNYSGTKVRDLKAEREKKGAKSKALRNEIMGKLQKFGTAKSYALKR